MRHTNRIPPHPVLTVHTKDQVHRTYSVCKGVPMDQSDFKLEANLE
jgi:hypothetical protein